ncbi:MAG TPA: DUF4350 domain-containing protein [Acidimicrobiia bacterium]|nr:DUF4350 domain-containing protein [Acidimicrobiia bacterium]
MENYSTLSRDRTFRKRSLKTIIFALISIVALYGIIFSAENYFAGSTPRGSQGSSYATISGGNRAWSELLAANSIKVTRDRGKATLPPLDRVQSYGTDLSSLRLDRTTQTVVVLAGALPSNEAKDVARFVRNGGRLITDNPHLLEVLLKNRVTVFVEGSQNLFPSSENVSGLDGIEEVEGSGTGSLTYKSNNDVRSVLIDTQDSQTDIAQGTNELIHDNAAIFRLGNGDVIALPDTGMVSNGGLPRKDNALFSLRIVGSLRSEVTFIEGVHGFDDARGFAGMPLSWRVAIVGLFVAFVIFACAQGRRFGVGEEPNRDLGPRRIYFAHALAQALKKSKR